MKKSLELIAAASGLSTDELREMIAALTRLIERRETTPDPAPNSSRVVIEQRRTRVATLQLELVKCGKSACKVCALLPAHGPYWYAYWKHEGRTRTKYIGKTLPESFTAYEKDSARPGFFTEQSFGVPRSYVTSRKRKSRRLHKTAKPRTRRKKHPS